MNINVMEYIKEYLLRNKNFILISIALLVISIIAGVLCHDLLYNYAMEIFEHMLGKLPANSTVTDEAIFLFTNNLRANVIIILFGFLFSIFSAAIVIFNGAIIGFTATMVSPITFIVGIVPHGIFELPALILSLTVAFMITLLEINLIDALTKGRFREELGNSRLLVYDIVITFIVIVILLIIAAVIEAGVTPVLLEALK